MRNIFSYILAAVLSCFYWMSLRRLQVSVWVSRRGRRLRGRDWRPKPSIARASRIDCKSRTQADVG